MITTDELKVQLAEHAKVVKDLEEALAIEASRACRSWSTPCPAPAFTMMQN